MLVKPLFFLLPVCRQWNDSSSSTYRSPNILARVQGAFVDGFETGGFNVYYENINIWRFKIWYLWKPQFCATTSQSGCHSTADRSLMVGQTSCIAVSWLWQQSADNVTRYTPLNLPQVHFPPTSPLGFLKSFRQGRPGNFSFQTRPVSSIFFEAIHL